MQFEEVFFRFPASRAHAIWEYFFGSLQLLYLATLSAPRLLLLSQSLQPSRPFPLCYSTKRVLHLPIARSAFRTRNRQLGPPTCAKKPICIHTYICICMYICMYEYTCMYIYVFHQHARKSTICASEKELMPPPFLASSSFSHQPRACNKVLMISTLKCTRLGRCFSTSNVTMPLVSS